MRRSIVFVTAVFIVLGSSAVWANLIPNGDFELGNVGFTSEYSYRNPGFMTLDGAGRYGIGRNTHEYLNPETPVYGDHTSGTGKMLIANGATDGRIVWRCPNVAVASGKDYVFSYFLSSWSLKDPAIIECRINGGVVGTDHAPSTTGTWIAVLYVWNSGASTTADIELREVGGAYVGNDFAIDDISMTEAGPDFHTLTVDSTEYGSVSLTHGGHGYLISHEERAFPFAPGEEVQLWAQPDRGWVFSNWSGSFFSSSNPVLVEMNGDGRAEANFQEIGGDVVIKASGAAPNVLSTSLKELTSVIEALESRHVAGLIVGKLGLLKGVNNAQYRFPIVKTEVGILALTKVSVHITGNVATAGPKAYIGTLGPYRPTNGNLHEVFTSSDEIAGILEEDPYGHPFYWLVVEIDGEDGRWDIEEVRISYECPGVPQGTLQRLHDHFSVYQALHCYANDPTIQSLYGLKGNEERLWKAIMTTVAYAQDLAVVAATGSLDSAIQACKRFAGLRDLLQKSVDLVNFLAMYPLVDGGYPTDIIGALDRAVPTGEDYISTFGHAVADGWVSEQEALDLNLKISTWQGDLKSLNSTMDKVFMACRRVYFDNTDGREQQYGFYVWEDDEVAAVQAQLMITSMAPWIVAELASDNTWVKKEPSYLDEVIVTLDDFPQEEISAGE